MIEFSFESIPDNGDIFRDFSETITAFNYIIFSLGQPIKTKKYAFFTISFAKNIVHKYNTLSHSSSLYFFRIFPYHLSCISNDSVNLSGKIVLRNLREMGVVNFSERFIIVSENKRFSLFSDFDDFQIIIADRLSYFEDVLQVHAATEIEAKEAGFTEPLFKAMQARVVLWNEFQSSLDG